MPTVFTFDGFRVVIYPNDHRPAHVHVVAADCEAVFELNCPNGPVELREAYGCSRSTLGDVARALTTRLALACKRWREIHEAF
jgi:hypothetical protein